MSQNCEKSRLYELLDFMVYTATGVYLVGTNSHAQVAEISTLLIFYWLAKGAIQDLSRREKTPAASAGLSSDEYDDEDDDLDDDVPAYDNWRIDEDDEEEDIYGDEAELLEYEYGKAKRG
jgi:hypothetical protein